MKTGVWAGPVSRQGGERGSVILAVLTLLAMLAASVASLFQFSGDAAALRNTAMVATGGGWERVVQLGLGRLPFALADWGMSFADLEPEVRTAVGSVRGVEVGVYERRGVYAGDLGAVMMETDKAMSRRGWYRMVGVMDDGDLVAVYTPAKADVARDLRVCVMVVSRGEMVVVSARCNPEPLVSMAMEVGKREGIPGWQAQMPLRLGLVDL